MKENTLSLSSNNEKLGFIKKLWWICFPLSKFVKNKNFKIQNKFIDSWKISVYWLDIFIINKILLI